MKQTAVFFLFGIISFTTVYAQNEPITVKWTGYVRYEAFHDTRQSLVSREGDVYFWPLRAVPDETGKDINTAPRLEMLAMQSRMGATISGPETFGASTSARIEVDYVGTSSTFVRMPRLRHAFIKLNWPRAELLLGQYWHPLFALETFPRVISFGGGLPFQPFARAPQVRFTHQLLPWLKYSAAAISHGYHRSLIDQGTEQSNAVVPELLANVSLGNKRMALVGITGSLRRYKPQLSTTNLLGQTFKTDAHVQAYAMQSWVRHQGESFSLSVEATYGTDMSGYSMLGGVGTVQGSYNYSNGSVDYTTWKTGALFADIEWQGPVKLGLYAGITRNLGANDKVDDLLGNRGQDIARVYRLSPRIAYQQNNMELALEWMYTSATYIKSYTERYEAKNTFTPVGNLRTLLSVKYAF